MVNKFKVAIVRSVGCLFFMVGMGGLAGACEGHGGFLVSLVAVGIGMLFIWLDMKFFE